MKLIAIKTDKGYYITDNIKNTGYHSTDINNMRFDGEDPSPTFHKDWFLIKGIPKKVGRATSRPMINERFELKAPEMFPKLKKIYKAKEVVFKNPCSENDYTRELTEGFQKIASLYTFQYEMGEMVYEPVEFEFVVLAEMKGIPDKEPFKYEVYKTKWTHEGTTNLHEKDIMYLKMIDNIIVPPILKHTRECFINSHDTYRIIRCYIKKNIDLEVAEITSDYGFCFGVSKIIKLVDNEKYTIDKNMLKKRAKPKYETRYRSNRKVQIFEMTWSPECYGSYTPIKGFKGKNEKDLKNNVDKFLKDLIAKINEPLVECPRCKGLGVIVEKK